MQAKPHVGVPTVATLSLSLPTSDPVRILQASRCLGSKCAQAGWEATRFCTAYCFSLLLRSHVQNPKYNHKHTTYKFSLT